MGTEPSIEQIGDGFGITVRYEPHEAHVDFFAYEVLGVSESGQKWYWRKGAEDSSDNTDSIADAEHYVKGSVKWDGCSHLNFGDEGYLHLCGRADFDKLTEALPVIYERCGALMAAAGQYLLEGEFKIQSPTK